MVVTGVLCAMNGFADIEEFCNEDLEWFQKWIKLPNGIPRAQTFSNILALKGNQGDSHKEVIDHNQTRKANAAKNLGTVRRIVLNILKEDPGIKGSLPEKRRRALMNRTYRQRLLSLA